MRAIVLRRGERYECMVERDEFLTLLIESTTATVAGIGEQTKTPANRGDYLQLAGKPGVTRFGFHPFAAMCVPSRTLSGGAS